MRKVVHRFLFVGRGQGLFCADVLYRGSKDLDFATKDLKGRPKTVIENVTDCNGLGKSSLRRLLRITTSIARLKMQLGTYFLSSGLYQTCPT
jgi:hypothetical protein